jgi:hypothetical protein
VAELFLALQMEASWAIRDSFLATPMLALLDLVVLSSPGMPGPDSLGESGQVLGSLDFQM